jgi:hypothetical protein
MCPLASNGANGNEMHIIFLCGPRLTQVSDVAHGPLVLTRLGTNHPWRERIQVPLKEGDSPSPRGNNSERVKIHRKFLKIFFARTRKPKLSFGEKDSSLFK